MIRRILKDCELLFLVLLGDDVDDLGWVGKRSVLRTLVMLGRSISLLISLLGLL